MYENDSLSSDEDVTYDLPDEVLDSSIPEDEPVEDAPVEEAQENRGVVWVRGKNGRLERS